MANGRPLWFIGGVVAAWTGVRVALLWPVAVPLPTADAASVAAAEPTGSIVPNNSPSPATQRPVASMAKVGERQLRAASMTGPPPNEFRAPIADRQDEPPTVVAKPAVASSGAPHPVIAPPIAAPPATIASRLHADAWFVARSGGGDNLAFGQLGASQGGARLTYALDRHVALSGRVSAPLRGTGREVGIGIDLKPTRLPVHLLAEQRIDLDGGTQRPAIIAIAGGSTALPGKARVDAYGQAGGVRHRGGFADGALLVNRPIRTCGNTRVEVGGGAWGAAQRRVARLDVGPSIALITPGAAGTLRLQLDYRARVAGRARPGSGPALTLGGSF